MSTTKVLVVGGPKDGLRVDIADEWDRNQSVTFDMYEEPPRVDLFESLAKNELTVKADRVKYIFFTWWFRKGEKVIEFLYPAGWHEKDAVKLLIENYGREL